MFCLWQASKNSYSILTSLACVGLLGLRNAKYCENILVTSGCFLVFKDLLIRVSANNVIAPSSSSSPNFLSVANNPAADR